MSPDAGGAGSNAASVCPGCGVVLPIVDWPVDARANASAACAAARAQVMEFEAGHILELGRLHQLTIDAYGAQHGGPGVPAIVVPFGLIGLHLAIEEAWSGIDVRGAHQFLAQSAAGRRGTPARAPTWPAFQSPRDPEWLTIGDVAGAPTTEEHVARVERWARSVWQAWSAQHLAVRAWAASALPPDVRRRIQDR